jgi:short-subunit dehydrogenase
VVCLAADLSKTEATLQLVSEVKRVLDERKWSLFAFIHSAGMGLVAEGVSTEIDALVEQIIQVNTLSAYTMIRHLYTRMEQDHTRILVVSSAAGIYPGAFVGAYAMSKHAVQGLCDSLRVEFRVAKSNCQITTVLPGLIKTQIIESRLMGTLEDQEAKFGSSIFWPFVRGYQRFTTQQVQDNQALLPSEVANAMFEQCMLCPKQPPRPMVDKNETVIIRLLSVLPTWMVDWLTVKILEHGKALE